MKLIVYNGKKYLPLKATHRKGDDRLHLIPFDEEKYDIIISDIANAVKNAIDAEKVIRQL